MNADRNLLFGILAVQTEFITRDQLITALNAWVLTKGTPLGDLLVRQGALAPERHALLEALVNEQLKQHGGDPGQSLAAVSSVSSMRPELERIMDADVQASLVHLRPAQPDGPQPGASSTAAPDCDPAATRAGTIDSPRGRGVRFRIVRPHAEGGLGKVYVALDEELNREVALKEIKDRHADNADSRARFVMEAEITGGLEHPGVVPVYGLGQYADGRPFYAMRFIRGDSLEEAIERFHHSPPVASGSPLNSDNKSLDRFLGLAFRKLLGGVFLDVCNAIAYAHSRGVLHRDLKPGNIMLGKYGETLVVDWGLAKAGVRGQESGGKEETPSDELPLHPAAASGSSETVAGSAIGTPQYMSPEQAAGRLDLLGPASDVYSLGATLYCVLTGKTPFEEPDVGSVLRKVQKGEFPAPRQLNRHIPPALEAVCLKAMAVRPQDRYPSPRELADDVERWLADERVHAHAEPWSASLGRWARRHRTTVSAAAGLLIAAAILLGVSTMTFREMHQEAEVLRDRADKALAAGQRSAYVNAVRLAREHWEDSDLEEIPELLANALPAELRSWEWGHLNQLLHGPARMFPVRTPFGANRIAFHPSGKMLVCLGDDLHLVDVNTAATVQTLAKPAQPLVLTSFALDPDGKRCAVGHSDGSVSIQDLSGGTPVLLQAHQSDVQHLAFSPRAGGPLASGDRDGAVKLWDHAGRALHTLAPAAGWRMLAFSPDGKHLAIGGEGVITLWDSASGRASASLTTGAGAVEALAFDPKHSRLASVHQEGRLIKLWDLPAGNELLAIRPRLGKIEAIAFTTDGRRLATGSRAGRIKLWEVVGGAEVFDINLVSLVSQETPVRDLAFSPDGLTLAAATESAGVFLWKALPWLDPSAGVAHAEAHR